LFRRRSSSFAGNLPEILRSLKPTGARSVSCGTRVFKITESGALYHSVFTGTGMSSDSLLEAMHSFAAKEPQKSQNIRFFDFDPLCVDGVKQYMSIFVDLGYE